MGAACPATAPLDRLVRLILPLADTPRVPVTCRRVITHNDGSGRLDDTKMRRLATLVHSTGSVIAISSNWRLFRELKARLTLALQKMGSIRVIGATPDHGERTHGGAVRPEEIVAFLKSWRCVLAKAPPQHPPTHLPPHPLPTTLALFPTPLGISRGGGCECEKGISPRREASLDAPPSAPGRRRRGAPIETWCAVDDRPLHEETGGKYLEGHFVQVHERHGLTDRACVRRLTPALQPAPRLSTPP